jgi:hypothetical protein
MTSIDDLGALQVEQNSECAHESPDYGTLSRASLRTENYKTQVKIRCNNCGVWTWYEFTPVQAAPTTTSTSQKLEWQLSAEQLEWFDKGSQIAFETVRTFIEGRMAVDRLSFHTDEKTPPLG